jgi:hypothetical protein
LPLTTAVTVCPTGFAVPSGITASEAVAKVTVGASFTGTIFNVNVSATLNIPSLATTWSETVPFAFAGGIPLNVAVTGSNASQLGNGEPSVSDAASVRFGLSASLNVFAGILKDHAVSSFEL